VIGAWVEILQGRRVCERWEVRDLVGNGGVGGREGIRVGQDVRRDRPSGSLARRLYELFESKDECLFAAYEKVLDVLVAYVARACKWDRPWPLKIRRAIQTCLEACSAAPEVARMTTVDVPAARPEAQRRCRDALERSYRSSSRARVRSG
jgi:hypothetical protein